jgi:hypothetical protein
MPVKDAIIIVLLVLFAGFSFWIGKGMKMIF